MHSIAQTYSDLGRYQLSLDFSKKSLNFRIENCPNDHLEIGHALTLQTIVVEMFRPSSIRKGQSLQNNDAFESSAMLWKIRCAVPFRLIG
jgi:hypothetical protein